MQGTARLVSADEAREIGKKVHAKYIKPEALADPAVSGFFETMDDAAIILEPEKWIFWDMAELDQQVFAGALAEQQAFFEIVP